MPMRVIEIKVLLNMKKISRQSIPPLHSNTSPYSLLATQTRENAAERLERERN